MSKDECNVVACMRWAMTLACWTMGLSVSALVVMMAVVTLPHRNLPTGTLPVPDSARGGAKIYSNGDILYASASTRMADPKPLIPLTTTSADTLLVGMSLPQGIPLRSNNGAYYLVVQGDGNLVLYASSHFHEENMLWRSHTAGEGMAPFQLKVQEDGNLVLYDATGRATWAPEGLNLGTRGHTHGHRHLMLQDDGNLVLYNHKKEARWATGTERGMRVTGVLPTIRGRVE